MMNGTAVDESDHSGPWNSAMRKFHEAGAQAHLFSVMGSAPQQFLLGSIEAVESFQDPGSRDEIEESCDQQEGESKY